ncbi:MAG TPA: endonuclease domain-containing protein [Cyclobacteriaceae bacterium]|jgi:very-short-patch-repair endonuclease|nr:endonuclease domain-containing protein [Cyclobacteriaceae bacterium]
MYYLPYNKDLKQFSRDLRNHSTYGEVLLWMELRAGQLKGYKFNRQKPLGKYIVDFFCKKLNLVIEVDGESHDSIEARLKDERRQLALEKLGLSFLRFDDLDVKNKMEMVLQRIVEFIEKFERANLSGHANPPAPPFLSKGGQTE